MRGSVRRVLLRWRDRHSALQAQSLRIDLVSFGPETAMNVYPNCEPRTVQYRFSDMEVGESTASTHTSAPVTRDSPPGAKIELFRLARKFGSHILTETMEHRPEIGLKSYDRLFPNQDTLPKGGFGNLIALPLQKAARRRGNSVFVDDQFRPLEDQWAFLAALPRMSRARVEALVRLADCRGRIIGVRFVAPDEEDEDPWTTPPSRRPKEPPIVGPLPEKLELVLADQIYIGKEGLVPALRNRLLRLAAFQNPEFYRAQAMRLPTYDKPRIIACAEDHPKHIALPRGCLDEVRQTIEALKIQPVQRDERYGGSPLNVSFCGALRPQQEAAALALL